MTKQQQFFYDNAGGSWNPATETWQEGTARYAAELAQAETYAQEQGWFFTWEADDIPCQHEDGEDHEAEVCDLNARDHALLGSLSGICGATDEYRRVVQAELALEAKGRHVAATAPAEPQEAAPAPVTVSDLIDYLLANVENPRATRVFLTEREAAQVQTDEFITLESVYQQFQEVK
jgi:hypothetical protein